MEECVQHPKSSTTEAVHAAYEALFASQHRSRAVAAPVFAERSLAALCSSPQPEVDIRPVSRSMRTMFHGLYSHPDGAVTLHRCIDIMLAGVVDTVRNPRASLSGPQLHPAVSILAYSMGEVSILFIYGQPRAHSQWRVPRWISSSCQCYSRPLAHCSVSAPQFCRKSSASCFTALCLGIITRIHIGNVSNGTLG